MKSNKLIPIAILGTLVLTSCNKGVGCPNNFSISAESAEQLLVFAQLILNWF